MNYETIGYAVRNDVAIIKLNRPDAMNAMNSQMRAELLHAIKTGDQEARVLVLTGAGKAFCAGQDLADRGSAASLDLERTLRDEYEPILRAIHECRIPVIAAVNGAAAGAGANIALAADVVIATESAIFLQAFARIGLIPDAGGTWFLPRQIGLARAMGASLFAEPISAKKAEQWGMIWEAVPDAEFADHWWGRASTLASGPTEAYSRIKRALNDTWGNGLQEQLELEAKLQGECGKTRDFKEGVVSFLEKRKPSFEGR